MDGRSMKWGCLEGNCPQCIENARVAKEAIDDFKKLSLRERLNRLIEIGILDSNGDLAEQYRCGQ